MIAILTKFIGPTNYRGARIKAWRGDDPTVSVTIGYDYASGSEDRHKAAAIALCDRFGWLQDGRTIVGGGTQTGYAFVFTASKAPIVEQMRDWADSLETGRVPVESIVAGLRGVAADIERD